MCPRVLQDFEIKSKVKAILVRIGFDTAALTIGVHRRMVSLIGNLKGDSSSLQAKVIKRIKEDPFMENDDPSDENLYRDNKNVNRNDPTIDKLLLLEIEIEKIPGVRNLTIDFNNYKKNGGVWKKK